MSDRDEELELAALQRQLDDAFETTRPRRGFEDELWLRMQRRRPFGTRLRDALGGLVAGIREAPAIPLGAVALLVIVVIGVGVLQSGFAPFATHRELATSGGAGAAQPRNDSAGRLPTPVLHPNLVDQSPSAGFSLPAPAAGPTAAGNLYFGPANLVWAGAFPATVGPAPVLVYAEPTAAQMQAELGTFGSLDGVVAQTRGTVAALPREPVFLLYEQAPGVPAGKDPVLAADEFLVAHNLGPSQPFNVVVAGGGSSTSVLFQRALTLPNGGSAFLVDWQGERYGTQVDIVDGRRAAVGPLPLSLQEVSYPLISDADAAQAAVAEAPASAGAISPTPTVRLDHVELVYALATVPGEGFYEPAYLFSGSFTYNGQTYVKRVLVPLVAPAFRS